MTTSTAEIPETRSDDPSVALLGAPAAYHDTACDYLSPESGEDRRLRCADFTEIVSSLGGGAVDRAVIAVANSEIGTLSDAFDAMGDHDVQITAEVILRIRHQLLVRPEVGSLEEISKVVSNPKAINQCAGYLRHLLTDHPRITIDKTGADTASCAREVAEGDNPGLAAIAGRPAAERYGLKVLNSSIEDNPNNQTRFWMLERRARLIPDADKTSLMLALPHRSGALYDALGVWATRGISLGAIESQLTDDPEDPWGAHFYIAVEAGAHETRMADALDELSGQPDVGIELLGSYKAGEVIE